MSEYPEPESNTYLELNLLRETMQTWEMLTKPKDGSLPLPTEEKKSIWGGVSGLILRRGLGQDWNSIIEHLRNKISRKDNDQILKELAAITPWLVAYGVLSGSVRDRISAVSQLYQNLVFPEASEWPDSECERISNEIQNVLGRYLRDYTPPEGPPSIASQNALLSEDQVAKFRRVA